MTEISELLREWKAFKEEVFAALPALKEAYGKVK